MTIAYILSDLLVSLQKMVDHLQPLQLKSMAEHSLRIAKELDCLLKDWRGRQSTLRHDIQNSPLKRQNYFQSDGSVRQKQFYADFYVNYSRERSQRVRLKLQQGKLLIQDCKFQLKRLRNVLYTSPSSLVLIDNSQKIFNFDFESSQSLNAFDKQMWMTWKYSNIQGLKGMFLNQFKQLNNQIFNYSSEPRVQQSINLLSPLQNSKYKPSQFDTSQCLFLQRKTFKNQKQLKKTLLKIESQGFSCIKYALFGFRPRSKRLKYLSALKSLVWQDLQDKEKSNKVLIADIKQIKLGRQSSGFQRFKSQQEKESCSLTLECKERILQLQFLSNEERNLFVEELKLLIKRFQ